VALIAAVDAVAAAGFDCGLAGVEAQSQAHVCNHFRPSLGNRLHSSIRVMPGYKCSIETGEKMINDKAIAYIFLLASLILHGVAIYSFIPDYSEIYHRAAQEDVPHVREQIVLAEITEAAKESSRRADKNSSPAPKEHFQAKSENQWPASKDKKTANTYFSENELTRQAELIGGDPSLIDLPPDSSLSGYAVLQIAVHRQGRAASIDLIRSTLPKEIVQDLITQFYQASYRAGEIDGKTVNSHMRIVIQVDNL
jgi:hypothetical protein